MEKSDAMLIKAAITYWANIIEPLPYLLIKIFNFNKNFFIYLVFFLFDIPFSIQGFSLYFLFLYSSCSSGLSCYFLFIAELFLLFLIEFLILFLACKVQLTLNELNLKVETQWIINIIHRYYLIFYWLQKPKF